MPSAEDTDRIGQVLLSRVIGVLSIPNIRTAVAEAGLDAAGLTSNSEQRSGYTGSRAELTPQILALWKRADAAARERALPILAERLLNTAHADEAMKLLGQHGFRFENGAFIPTNVIDERERSILPRTSFDELTKAAQRIFDGDYTGAITSACGAVDSLMHGLYAKNGWGDVPNAFQAKVNTALKNLTIFETLEAEFVAHGMPPADARNVIANLAESIKRATDAIQILRRTMGDVHGSKLAMRHLSYDTVKYCSAICALFENHDPA